MEVGGILVGTLGVPRLALAAHDVDLRIVPAVHPVAGNAGDVRPAAVGREAENILIEAQAFLGLVGVHADAVMVELEHFDGHVRSSVPGMARRRARRPPARGV